MALFGTVRWKPGEYEVKREEGNVKLVFHYENSIRSPSIEDDPETMAHTIEVLGEVKEATIILFHQQRIYEYDFFQVNILKELSVLYNQIIRSGALLKYDVDQRYTRIYDQIYNQLTSIIYGTFKADPIKAYVMLRRLRRRVRLISDESNDSKLIAILKKYDKTIEAILQMMDSTRLMTLAKPHLSEYKDGDRSIYRNYIFSPTIKPDFMYTKLLASYPLNGIELDHYSFYGADITIFSFPDSVKYMYHIVPPEFKLSEDEYELIDLARNIMAEHKPQKSDFVDPDRMRNVFYNIGRELIQELADHKGISLDDEKLSELAQILVRYTVGFGLVELLLSDPKIQDVNVNSPYGDTAIFVVHEDFDDCTTNIFPTIDEANSWATKLRMISGRPLDEANQLLDTELELPGASIRVSALNKPLDPTGLAFSFRRHRDKPWTLPLLMKYKSLNAYAAGLISFLVDGTRSFLICGTRGSGKTSLLTALLVEIMRRYRIITVEDTLEIPSEQFRKLGYNIQQMKVSSALSLGGNEMSADNGIRATLRMGDSSLIVGEVRSTEALALYEAMRVGAAANVVAGTIHGDSPYGIFDRVVNDIGVNATSFKATDIIIIVKPLKTPDGLHKIRRVVQITEVRKDWVKDPKKEMGFVDLMKYDPTKDELVPTDSLLNGDSEILKIIASGVAEFSNNWDAMMDNIKLRARVKQEILDSSLKLNDPELLEAEFVVLANDLMHLSIQEIKEETGSLDHNMIYDRWLKKYYEMVINKKDELKQKFSNI